MVFLDFHGFLWTLEGSGARVLGGLWRLVAFCGGLWRAEMPCGSGLDLPNIKIWDSGGLDLEAWCLDAWMLAGLEGIGRGGRGDGGDGWMGAGYWKKFSHARASGARRISTCVFNIVDVWSVDLDLSLELEPDLELDPDLNLNLELWLGFGMSSSIFIDVRLCWMCFRCFSIDSHQFELLLSCLSILISVHWFSFFSSDSVLCVSVDFHWIASIVIDL